MSTPVAWAGLPGVQDALDFALAKLADWQLVPGRIARARSEVQRVAADAVARGDVATVAQLTLVKQSLDGIDREVQDAGPLVSSVLNAARTAQAGGSLAPGTVVDAARLATIMAANMTALAQNEQAVQSFGGHLAVGAGGGVMVAAWLKWVLIGLGAYWLFRRGR